MLQTAPATEPAPLLAVDGLSVHFRRAGRLIQVLDRVTFSVGRGEAIGLVGESGSGKTVTGLSILGLLPAEARISGRVRFDGADLLSMPENQMRRFRGRRIGMVFQEPMTALDPVFTIGEQIGETLQAHFPMGRREARARAVDALAQVGIPMPERRVDDYPHHLSGGMRQRVVIAIALACEPSLLIADEPTTALDVTIQAQIVELLLDQVQKRGTALVFVSHNLGIVSQACARMVTMYAGQVVEDGPVDDVIENPLHPYTSGLIGSLPRLRRWRQKLPSIGGRVPSPSDMPAGCRFAPRCPHREPRCAEPQVLESLRRRHAVRCRRAGEIELSGAVA